MGSFLNCVHLRSGWQKELVLATITVIYIAEFNVLKSCSASIWLSIGINTCNYCSYLHFGIFCFNNHVHLQSGCQKRKKIMITYLFSVLKPCASLIWLSKEINTSTNCSYFHFGFFWQVLKPCASSIWLSKEINASNCSYSNFGLLTNFKTMCILNLVVKKKIGKL